MSTKSVTARTRDFRTLRLNIFAKTKKVAKPFLPVRMWPRSNLLSKEKMVENLVTLSLTGTIWVEH